MRPDNAIPRKPYPRKPGELCGGESGNILDRLMSDLRTLDREVKQDEAGKDELGLHLAKLENEHKDLKKALDAVTEEYNKYAIGAGIFEKEYSQHLDNTHNTYNHARGVHKQGMAVLSRPDTFNYHQSYRRQGDQFSGTYFTPLPLKRAEEKKSNAAKKADRLARSSAPGGAPPSSETPPA